VRRQALFPVEVGVGLNTGVCCVSNMGSEQRFDYLVLGDDVNLASRLEGQTKAYGVDIMIGENTQAQAGNFAVLEVDLIHSGQGQDPPGAHLRAAGRRSGEGRRGLPEARRRAWRIPGRLYRSGQWPAARERLAALHALYEERLTEYGKTSPPTGWDGAYVPKVK
jgi:adenylate cyclase